MPLPPRPRKIEFTVSWATILKVLVAALVVGLVVELWPLLALLLLAFLVAITLFPVLHWTRRRGWRDWTGILMISLVLLALVTLLGGILIPTLAIQAAEIAGRMPEFLEDVTSLLPAAMQEGARRIFESVESQAIMQKCLEWGSLALKGLAQFLIVLVLAVYLVADGERVFRWMLAFLPERNRRKVHEASPEISTVVSSYMFGQLVTSLLCGAFAFAILSLLHVPNAVLLAVLAAIFDVLPIIGFVLALIPAVLMAAAVSPTTAGLVLALYVGYHLVETYFIIPRIYGNRLRLSTLTVLVSCMAAALVAGIVGAIAILPVVASYPIIERLWLRRHLEPDTVEKHAQIIAEEHPEK